MKNKVLCIYHLADHDGKGSAAIVGSVFEDVEFFGYDHNMNVPVDLVKKYEQIVICDIALPVDLMFELNEKCDLTWIDHHISVMKEYDEKLGGRKPIKGLRRVGTAAVELTWEYFYPNKPVPEGVKLLALNDMYDLRNEKVRPFEYGMQSLGVNKPDDEVWRDIFSGALDVDAVVEKGDAILAWVKMRNFRLSRSIAFEAEYKGLKGICANMPQGYSEFFDSLPGVENYDFMVNFYMDKSGMWKMTFYTGKDDVDVSKIAGDFGGGGHRAAAGASKLKELPKFLRR